MTSRTARTTTRTAVLLAATAGLLLAPVGAASAQTVTNKDTHGDVERFTYDGDSTSQATDPDQTDGDITRTRLIHAGKVGVVVHFVDLERVGDERIDFLKIATNEGLHRNVFLDASKGHWAGAVSVTKPNGTEVTCKGLTRKIDYEANTVDIRVPRSCLSNPKWVRLGFGAAVDTQLDDGTQTTTVDDAIRDAPFTNDEADPKLSGRIHRAS